MRIAFRSRCNSSHSQTVGTGRHVRHSMNLGREQHTPELQILNLFPQQENVLLLCVCCRGGTCNKLTVQPIWSPVSPTNASSATA